jgi:hypothetical protein
MFALERVLIYSGLSHCIMVPSVPEDLAIELKRRCFLLSMDQKKTGYRSMLRSVFVIIVSQFNVQG